MLQEEKICSRNILCIPDVFGLLRAKHVFIRCLYSLWKKHHHKRMAPLHCNSSVSKFIA